MKLPTPSHRAQGKNVDAVQHQLKTVRKHFIDVSLPTAPDDQQDENIELAIGSDAKAVFVMSKGDFQQLVNVLLKAHKDIGLQ